MNATRSVVVIYEDPEARQRAVEFCDNLVRQFWKQHEFVLKWWPFADLQEVGCFKEAAVRAAQADFVVFSCASDAELPTHVGAWIEHWVSQRGDREGSLASLIDPANAATPKQLYLRAVAHRARMDYLNQVPEQLPRSFSESIDSYSERAAQMTDLLEEILRNHPNPRL